MDITSTDPTEGIVTYKRMLQQLHLYVCQTSDRNALEKRTLLQRATDWMKMEKVAGEVYADVCIVPFASGFNGYFTGDYTGWPQGLGEYMYNAHCMIVTNIAIVAAFDTYVVLGAMEATVGATTDLATLPEMIQPSEISCNLHVAAPATCMLLQTFTGNPA